MASVGLVTFTIGELTEDLAVLQKYQDPFGHLDDCTPAWYRALTANPAANPSDLAIIFALDGNVIVGRLGMWAAEAAIDGVKTPAFLLSLFVVSEDYRNTGAGAMLLLRAISQLPSLVAAGPVPPDVQKIYQAAGFRELGPLPRYVYFYKTKVIFSKFLGNSWPSSVLSFLTTPLLRAYYLIKRRNPNSDLTFKPITALGDGIDGLTRQGSYFPRSSGTLNWILRTRDNVRGFEVFRRGQLCGYCLVRVTEAPAQTAPRRLPAMRVGCLLDHYIEEITEGEQRALLDFCLAYFKPKGADVFECLTNNEAFTRVCAKRGMLRLGGFQVLFRPPRGKQVPGREDWRLTHGEGDVILGQEGFGVDPVPLAEQVKGVPGD